ncbi:hydrogenase maturation nickel metallochaperone HypA [Ostreiculturibacter nitratireducens]|uniref:hydrogenase maturation nickel metallochaperone HypA n=1 Tax=Ostreiculturibacter nitratireducens TaxID=3075226 RepID=UPI0031B5DB79
MHELSLARAIREIVEDEARARGFRRVLRLRLEIGAFAAVEKSALAFAFEAAMQGSPAEGAELEIIDLPGRAHCYDCGEEVELAGRLAPCPRCGGERLRPTGGDEMRVKDMEVA